MKLLMDWLEKASQFQTKYVIPLLKGNGSDAWDAAWAEALYYHGGEVAGNPFINCRGTFKKKKIPR